MMVHPKLHPALKAQAHSTERVVLNALKRLGYHVEVLGLLDDLDKLEQELSRLRPYAVFNLLEEFDGEAVYDFHLPSYLEAHGIPCTGCNPRGLAISRSKFLWSRLAQSVGVPVPDTGLVGAHRYPGKFPAFVKYNREHSSRGISRANRVRNVAEMKRVIKRMSGKYPGEIIVQEFIEGADVTVSVIGNDKLTVFEPRKLRRNSARDFSTERVKFNAQFRAAHQIRAQRYKGPHFQGLQTAAKTIYRELELSGYARMDFRMNEGGFYLVDVNANPNLELIEDFVASAKFSGYEFDELINEIIKLARSYKPRI